MRIEYEGYGVPARVTCEQNWILDMKKVIRNNKQDFLSPLTALRKQCVALFVTLWLTYSSYL